MNHLKPLLATYAYNITRSHEASLDIVQDAFLKFLQVDSAQINSGNGLVKSFGTIAETYDVK